MSTNLSQDILYMTNGITVFSNKKGEIVMCVSVGDSSLDMPLFNPIMGDLMCL